jgi:hypothetical protein
MTINCQHHVQRHAHIIERRTGNPQVRLSGAVHGGGGVLGVLGGHNGGALAVVAAVDATGTARGGEGVRSSTQPVSGSLGPRVREAVL